MADTGSDIPCVRTSAWERSYERFEAWFPYVTLGISTLVGSLNPETPWETRAGTAVLAAMAAAWVLLTFTRAPASWREQPRPVVVHFAGLLALAALLMAREPVFFLFAITGFLHARLLRPLPMVFVGTGSTSVVLNTVLGGGFPELAPGPLTFYVLIVLVQTVLIGLGVAGGEKLAEVSEQRRQTVADLEATLEENAGLHAQLLVQAREAGILDERQRMAREIHDTLAQGLAGVITQIEAADNSRERPREQKRYLDTAARLARDSLSEARRSVHALGPEPLEHSPLPDAVAGVVDRWAKLHEVDARFAATGTPRSLHPEIEATLLRIAQEALANVGKHAKASRAGITLSYMGDVVTLDVRDDGIGLPVPGATNGNGRNGGFGLTAIRQRVDRLAGTLEIESEPGGGTALSATFPAVPATVPPIPDGDPA